VQLYREIWAVVMDEDRLANIRLKRVVTRRKQPPRFMLVRGKFVPSNMVAAISTKLAASVLISNLSLSLLTCNHEESFSVLATADCTVAPHETQTRADHRQSDLSFAAVHTMVGRQAVCVLVAGRCAFPDQFAPSSPLS
jgi:hypothetical protein